ncbi:hypothetical protein ENUP19_0341G0031 [Entamoeba nuttalli]|uniref:Uncharacterized protein n=1 Tax=Entamoeba nuttalli TaxID=412467 RepID=A0ABQ0DXN8_9EUKA
MAKEEESLFKLYGEVGEEGSIKEVFNKDTRERSINYIIHFFGASRQSDITMFYASKKKGIKKNEYQIKFYFQPLKGKFEGERYYSILPSNFKIISVAWNKDKDCILYVLKMINANSSRYALFCTGNKASYEAVEIQISTQPIEEYFTIQSSEEESKNNFYLISSNWVKLVSIHQRNIRKNEVLTVSSRYRETYCSICTYNGYVYLFTLSEISRIPIGMLETDKIEKISIKNSQYYEKFMVLYQQYKIALHVKCSNSALEQISCSGLDKYSFPITVNQGSDQFGNEKVGGGAVIMTKCILDNLFVICLSKNYCIVLITKPNSKEFECIYEDWSEEDKYMNIFYGFELFFIISKQGVIVLNTTNLQYVFINTKTNQLNTISSIGEKRMNGGRKIVSIDTHTLDLKLIGLNEIFFNYVNDPMINYTFLSHGFYPKGGINPFCYINFNNPTSEEIMENIIFQLGSYVLGNENSIYRNLLCRTVNNEGIYRLPFPHEKFEITKYSTLLPFMKTATNGTLLTKDQWKSKMGNLIEMFYKKKLDYKQFVDSYFAKLEEILRMIRKKFNETIANLNEERMILETIFFNGCMNKVYKELALEKEEDYCEVNVKFFQLYPFEIVVQFDALGIFELSISEASTILNQIKVQAERLKDPHYKIKEQLFVIRKLCSSDEEFKEMLNTITSYKFNNTLKYQKLDKYYSFYNETSPEMIFKRKVDEIIVTPSSTTHLKENKLLKFFTLN